jgi:hypothetical protein
MKKWKVDRFLDEKTLQIALNSWTKEGYKIFLMIPQGISIILIAYKEVKK